MARRLPEVECLRGLAIALVVAHHVNGRLYGGLAPSLVALPWPLAAVVLAGYTGVDLFFVLSGFLLSRPFLAEARGGRRVGRVGYAERRALRVMPLYVVAVAVASVMVARRPVDLLAGVPYLIFLNAFPGGARRLEPHSDPWWSLATEAQFYVLLPFLPLVLRSPRGRRVGLVLLLAYASVYAALSLHWLRPATLAGVLALAQSVVGRGPLFLAGIVAAFAYDRWADGLHGWAVRRPGRARLAGDAVLGASLVAVVALLAWAARLDYVTREAVWPAWHIAEGVVWGAVLLALLLFPGSLKRLLVNRVWAFLGVISYSLYLVHYPVISYGRRFVIRSWPGVLPMQAGVFFWTREAFAVALVLVAAAVGFATLAYVGIERPMLRVKERLAK